MPHLGIAHLVVGQANGSAAGLNQGVGIRMPEGIHHRSGGIADGVMVDFVAIAPAIEDCKHHWGHRGWISQRRKLGSGPQTIGRALAKS